MTERERWIVYPLLFLALGAALRDKLVDRTISKSIVCQELTVVDAAPVGNRPRILAQIGRTEPNVGVPSSGYLIVYGQLDVQGGVNARQYAYQGVPFSPVIQSLPLGVSWPDLMNALQQAAQQHANVAQPPQNQPPQPQSPQPSDPTPPAKPLAEPDQTR